MATELNTKVEVKEVSFDFVNSIILRGVYVEDLQNDTLVYVGELSTNIFGINLSDNKFEISNLNLDDSKFYLSWHEKELNLQFIIDQFSTNDTSASEVPLILCHHLNIRNFRFKLSDKNEPTVPNGINYFDLDVSNFNCEIADFKMINDSMYGTISGLNFIEKSGFRLEHLSGYAKVSPTILQVQNMTLKTSESNIKGNLHFVYNQWADYTEFIDNVFIYGNLDNSIVNFSDIAFFAPDYLWGINLKTEVSGNVEGSISKLNCSNLDLKFGNNSQIKGIVSIQGIPNMDKAYIIASVDNFKTNASDLRTIPIPPFDKNSTLEIPYAMDRLGFMQFVGNYSGYFSDFIAHGNFYSDIGNISGNIKMLNDTLKTKKYVYSGKIQSKNFDIGKLLVEDLLGAVTMNVKIDGNGLKVDNLNMKLNGLIQSIHFKQYKYNNINLNAEISKKKFNGKVTVKDDNIDLDFDGKVDLEPKLPEFKFIANIKYANLFNLNFTDRDSVSLLKTQAICNFTGNQLENIFGSVQLQNSSYEEGRKKIDIKSIIISASKDKITNEKTASFSSDFGTGSLIGNFESAYLPESFVYLLSQAVPAFFTDKASLKIPSKNHLFKYDFKIRNIEPILAVFYPNLKLNSELSFSGKYDSKLQEFSTKVNINDFTFNTIGFRQFEIDINYSESILTSNVFSNQINLTDSIEITDIQLLTKTTDNNIQFGLNWDNKGDKKFKGDIGGLANIQSKTKYKLGFFKSDLVLADSIWTIKANNQLIFDSTSLAIDQFILHSGNQSLSIDGRLSRSVFDKLKINLKEFNLSYFNMLTEAYDLKLEGIANGEATISDPTNSIVFNSNLTIKNSKINDIAVGNGRLSSSWDVKKEAIFIDCSFKNTGSESFGVKGYYYPSEKNENFDLKVDLDNINLGMLTPYTTSIFDYVEGKAVGFINIKGSKIAPKLNGLVQLKNIKLPVSYLHTNYTINEQSIVIEPDKFRLKDIEALDSKGNKALVSGFVSHKNFSDFIFDISIAANQNFECLNTTSKDNEYFYGKAFVDSANVKITGNPDHILMTIKARTAKGTSFSIPLDGPTDISESDYITFVNNTITTQKKEYQTKKSSLQLNFQLDITDDAHIQLIFDKTVGDVIKANGHGILDLEINTLGDFKMFGEYIIDEGDYLFTFKRAINKKFEIVKGSNLVWNGNPYDADMNIDAVYKLRTSLATLLNDSSQKRIPVDCHLKLTESLISPNIKFEIDLPTTSDNGGEALKTRIKAAISSEEEMNKQVFALLVLGNFMPQTTKDYSATGSLSSSSTEMLSNQLSNWLSQISKDFDVGVNYKSGNEISNEEVELALSTQLLNDRLILEGNLGVSDKKTSTASQNSNNLVGDVKVEYKITEDGRLRAKVYNKANDYNLAAANSSLYTQGVGIFYRKEFSTFSQLFKDLFHFGSNKKQKSNLKSEEEETNDSN